jgi:hypothetical protein
MDFTPRTATCRCGNLQIEVSAPPIMTAACHCRGCQRMSASAFSLTAIFPAQAFRVVKGTPVKGGIQGPTLDHFFCPDCKTWMFTRVVGMSDIVNLRPTMFDTPQWSDPFIETMTRSKLPWATTPARHSFAEFPSQAEFPRLIAEFAAERQ